jgi:hypothetical protein
MGSFYLPIDWPAARGRIQRAALRRGTDALRGGAGTGGR